MEAPPPSPSLKAFIVSIRESPPMRPPTIAEIVKAITTFTRNRLKVNIIITAAAIGFIVSPKIYLPIVYNKRGFIYPYSI
jgi:hypothetical protein